MATPLQVEALHIWALRQGGPGIAASLWRAWERERRADSPGAEHLSFATYLSVHATAMIAVGASLPRGPNDFPWDRVAAELSHATIQEMCKRFDEARAAATSAVVLKAVKVAGAAAQLVPPVQRAAAMARALSRALGLPMDPAALEAIEARANAAGAQYLLALPRMFASRPAPT